MTAFEDEVGGFDEFAHDGDDDDLGLFAVGGEAFGEGFDVGVATFGGECGQIDQASGSRAAAGDGGLALHLAGLSVVGSHAEQGGGLTAFEASEFGHSDQRAEGHDRSMAGQAGQQGEASLQVRLGPDPAEHVVQQLGLGPLQDGDQALEAARHVLEPGLLEAGLQLGGLVGDLLIGGQPLGQFGQPGVLGGPDGVDLGGGGGDQPGVDGVGLGPFALEPGVEPDLHRLVDHDLQSGRVGLSGFPCVGGRLNITPPWL